MGPEGIAEGIQLYNPVERLRWLHDPKKGWNPDTFSVTSVALNSVREGLFEEETGSELLLLIKNYHLYLDVFAVYLQNHPNRVRLTNLLVQVRRDMANFKARLCCLKLDAPLRRKLITFADICLHFVQNIH